MAHFVRSVNGFGFNASLRNTSFFAPRIFNSTGFTRRRFSSEESGHKTTAVTGPSFHRVSQLGQKALLMPPAQLEIVRKERVFALRQYKSLSSGKKEIHFMQICLNRFYREMGKTPIRIENPEDLARAFSFVKQALIDANVSPHEISDTSTGLLEVNPITSIIACISKYLANKDFPSSPTINTVSEFLWYLELQEDYIVPFVREKEDLDTMVKIIEPYIDQGTVYHEVGCGEGEGLVEILLRLIEKGKVPKAIVGTELNPYMLEVSKLFIEEVLGEYFNEVYLSHANASQPLAKTNLNEDLPPNVALGANRFFSILEGKALPQVLDSFHRQLRPNGYLVAGITTDDSSNIKIARDLLVGKQSSQYKLEDLQHGLGKVVYEINPFNKHLQKGRFKSEAALIEDLRSNTAIVPDDQGNIDISAAVDQVYYNRDKFQKVVEDHSFKFIASQKVVQSRQYSREVLLFQCHEKKNVNN